MRKDYEVTYTAIYRIVVTANSETEAKIKASETDSWDWEKEESEYTVEEIFDEE